MVLSEALSLVLVSVAVALLPGISRIVRLPAVVMEILFGVVLGKSLLNLEFSGDWLSFLAELGFLLLMFQAGMEIDFSMLRKQSKGQFFFHLGLFLATFGLSYLAAKLLGQGIFMALILSTTSLGLVMPTLRETGLSKTPLGQSMIIAATLADFLTLLGITFYVMWFEYGIGWRFLGPIPLFIGFGLLLKIGRLWAWWHPEKASRLLAADNSQEVGVRLALALLFLLVAISELVHIEPVLGAFLGGAMLSVIFREKIHLETKLSGIGFGFLIPLFFINVGMNFDLTNVVSPSQLLFTLKLLGMAILVKLLPSFLFTLNRVPFRKSFNMGILLSSRLSLIIVAASLGLEFGFITVNYKDAIVLLAVLTCLLAPSLFKVLNRFDEKSKPGDSRENKSGKRITAGWMRGR